MKKNSFIQGAVILAVSGIIVKLIGAVSRIYLSRLLGGEGIGFYFDGRFTGCHLHHGFRTQCNP